MALKTKIIIAICYTVLIFAVGRYTTRTPSSTVQTKTTEVETKTEDKNVNTKKTITETKKPDGTTVTVTQVDQTINDDKRDDRTTQVQTKETTKAVRPILQLSILGGNDFSQGPFKPVYGAAISKEVLGPVTLGLFGLTAQQRYGIIGISLGVNF